MKIVKEEFDFDGIVKAMESNNANMEKIDGIDTVVAVDPVYGKAISDEEKTKEKLGQVMKDAAKKTDGVTPDDPDTGKPLQKTIYTALGKMKVDEQVELDESLFDENYDLVEKKGVVEDLPDDVYSLVYDLVLNGTQFAHAHILPKEEERKIGSEKAYIRLEDSDIGVQLRNDETEEAGYVQKVADKLGLSTYKKTPAGGLAQGDYVLCIKISDDLATKSAEKFLEEKGFLDKVRDTATHKKKSDKKANEGKRAFGTYNKTITESWDDFDGYDDLIDKYMLPQGEGDTLASQAVTAVNKLVYKWFNDGDVYDTTGNMEGWANDLSTYANWLAKYIDGAKEVLDRIFDIKETNDEDEYEDILKTLCNLVLDPELLEELAKAKKEGSIYEEKGLYKFKDRSEDEDEDDDYEWEEEDEEVEDVDDFDESKELPESLKLVTTIDKYVPSLDAKLAWDKIVKAGKIDEIEKVLEDIYPDGIDTVDLDYMLATDPEMVLGTVGLANDDSVTYSKEQLDVFERLDSVYEDNDLEQVVLDAIDRFKSGIKVSGPDDFEKVREIALRKGIDAEYNDQTNYAKFVYEGCKKVDEGKKRPLTVGQKVNIHSSSSFHDGDWGEIVLINDDDDEYHVAMFGDKNDCPIFSRDELSPMRESKECEGGICESLDELKEIVRRTMDEYGTHYDKIDRVLRSVEKDPHFDNVYLVSFSDVPLGDAQLLSKRLEGNDELYTMRVFGPGLLKVVFKKDFPENPFETDEAFRDKGSRKKNSGNIGGIKHI